MAKDLDIGAVKAGHRTDGLVTKLDKKTEAYRNKHKGKDDSPPAGGVDKTPIPHAPIGFTIKITFHRASNLPIADLNALSSDPYILAQLNTKLQTRHKQDSPMRWRTETIRRTLEPVWNSEWIVANVPSSGFEMKARVYDEDPADHDDRLGNVNIVCPNISEDWEGIKEQSYEILKRTGSKRAYALQGCRNVFNRAGKMSGEVVISIEVLGRSDSENGGRMWTIGPCVWTKHQSPMIGRLTGIKDAAENSGKQKTDKYDFQANQLQLAGPVPEDLYHRYVEFKSFVAGMFTAKSFSGRILNRALHHQHSRIYNYDRTTIYGSFSSPCQDMTLKFLDLVHYDKGGRIFTYIITLDGMWRFTETGKEFGIDLLSKHTMHSDVNIYIAFSGEFFIRRLQSPHKSGSPDAQETHPPADLEGGPPKDDPPKDPAYYSLIIDNDSGTYRPSAELLPKLKAFMKKNLPGLKVVTLDCQSDKEKMDKWKEEQRERKKAESDGRAVVQPDDSSISSSDDSDLDEQDRIAQGLPKMSKKEKIESKMHIKHEGQAKVSDDQEKPTETAQVNDHNGTAEV